MQSFFFHFNFDNQIWVVLTLVIRSPQVESKRISGINFLGKIYTYMLHCALKVWSCHCSMISYTPWFTVIIRYFLPSKLQKERYTHMDCFTVDILWLLEAFGGARTGKFDSKPTRWHHLICLFQERWDILNTQINE